MILQRINLRSVGMALFALALIVGLVTRPVFVFRTTEYQTDQAIDSFVYQEMRQGHLPTLGPRSSIGAYAMPPLYYYLVFPFTLGSTNPAWQALPNALFSFLTIPLLGLLLWLLLERRTVQVRIFLAGLGALWWSMLAAEIRLANVEWSPTLIPFFLITSALLFRLALRSRGRQHILLWCGFGGALAVMSNLHSTALFAMPLLFLACVGFALVSRRDWKGLLVAFLTILTVLAVHHRRDTQRLREHARHLPHRPRTDRCPHPHGAR